MIYYYFICKRKLWYFANNIQMEQNSELVEIGKILDETSYSREEKGVLIDGKINVDFIKNGTVLHEVKKSKSIEEAGIWQLKYYLYYLENKGVIDISGKIDYPLLKQTKNIVLTDDDRMMLDKVVEDIKIIIENKRVPVKINEKICKNCAYYDLCYA